MRALTDDPNSNKVAIYICDWCLIMEPAVDDPGKLLSGVVIPPDAECFYCNDNDSDSVEKANEPPRT